ncbi:MAG: thiamine phosphate synthase [Acidaminobacteraceae bacterium]
MENSRDYLLYLVSDSRFEGSKSMYDQIEEAIKNGVTMLQFRDKSLGDEKFLSMAIKLRELTNRYSIPFIINDKVELAIKCGADGVHIGRSDMSIKEGREKLGTEMLIGSSVATVEEALKAQEAGANYLGVGAMFSTTTKSDTRSVTPDTLKEICNAINIPALAIGGINETNIVKLKMTGVSGVAVVSAIFAKNDIASATKELRNTCEGLFY